MLSTKKKMGTLIPVIKIVMTDSVSDVVIISQLSANESSSLCEVLTKQSHYPKLYAEYVQEFLQNYLWQKKFPRM